MTCASCWPDGTSLCHADGDPDYRKAEYAVMTRSDLKGRGLGWRLMRHLIDYARGEGLERLCGSVLAENTTMTGMCRQPGFDIRRDPEDPAILQVELPLSGTDEPRPP